MLLVKQLSALVARLYAGADSDSDDVRAIPPSPHHDDGQHYHHHYHHDYHDDTLNHDDNLNH